MYAYPLITQLAFYELPSNSPETQNEAYASVGGLEAQVQQVRDLLEIPLTRPELFRHYGTYQVAPPFFFFVFLLSTLLSLTFSCLRLLLLRVPPRANSLLL
jgi:hypothetical protein